MVSFTQEHNSICSQKQLNDIADEHTIIYRQLFAGRRSTIRWRFSFIYECSCNFGHVKASLAGWRIWTLFVLVLVYSLVIWVKHRTRNDYTYKRFFLGCGSLLYI